MKTNSFELSEFKTEVITFGSAQQLNNIELQALRIGECLVRVIQSVRNLIDTEITMETHMTAECHVGNILPPQRGSDGI